MKKNNEHSIFVVSLVRILRFLKEKQFMKIGTLVTVFALIFPLLASAKLHRCEEGGRIIFRSDPCLNEAQYSESFTKSNFGKTAPNSKQPKPTATNVLDQAQTEKTNISDPECRFSYFSIGDKKGKQLALNAKQECLHNKALKNSGQNERSYEAYQLWKDHYEMMSNQRNQALDRSINNNKELNCRSDLMGGFRCH